MTSPAPRQPRIAIVGAGPVGCTLARLLHIGGLSASVFEAEESPNYRWQGGQLDLHTTTGIAALEEAGLFDAFVALARYNADVITVADRSLNTLFHRANPSAPLPAGEKVKDRHRYLDEQRPEIERAALRRMLTESLPDGMVQWDRKVDRVEQQQEGGGEGGKEDQAATGTTMTLVFRDGTTAPGFDLVVGADGTWSRVRPFLSDVQPAYRGGLFEMHVPDAAAAAPDLHAATGGGSLFALSTGNRFAAQAMGDGSLMMATFMLPAGDAQWVEQCDYDPSDPAAVAAALVGPASDGSSQEAGRQAGGGETSLSPPPFADFHPAVVQAIRAATQTTPRTLFVLPPGFKWPHRRGATLVGDAAHVMTPFAGEGVNVGMEDALTLAKGILAAVAAGAEEKDGQDKERAMLDALDKAVAAWEEAAAPRIERVARLSDDLFRLQMHSQDPTELVVKNWRNMRMEYGKERAAAAAAAAAVS